MVVWMDYALHVTIVIVKPLSFVIYSRGTQLVSSSSGPHFRSIIPCRTLDHQGDSHLFLIRRQGGTLEF